MEQAPHLETWLESLSKDVKAEYKRLREEILYSDDERVVFRDMMQQFTTWMQEIEQHIEPPMLAPICRVAISQIRSRR